MLCWSWLVPAQETSVIFTNFVASQFLTYSHLVKCLSIICVFEVNGLLYLDSGKT